MVQCRRKAGVARTNALLERVKPRGAVWIALFLTLHPGPGFAAGDRLTLEETERLALQADLTAPRFEALANARKEQAVAAGQLPDPKLKLGAMNLPIDSFDRKQENMTQMQVGIQQSFPPGRTLGLRSEQAEVLAGADQARARSMTRQVLRDVRERYLDIFYQVEAGRIIDSSRELFDQLLEVTRFYYAQGRKNQQDVLRASVELSLLDDRRTRVRTEEDKLRADLARLIGPQAAYRPLSETFPDFGDLPSRAELDAAIITHPSLQADDIVVEAGQVGVNIARQNYKPGWMLDVTYGNRAGDNPDGSSRDDFLSAMVIMDIPLFTGKRQDRQLATRQQEVEAARLKRDDDYLRLKRQLDADYAEWLRLDERLKLYRDTIFPEAIQNAEASLTAYQSGVTDFTGVMRARITELDVKLQKLRLRVDKAKAEARLLYLASNDRK
ncbi:MAG TPA: TolC family protein [Gammaproteobacteria bacterium]|nr:TolC family protein [Gammaproteobacteria bacterium]